MKSNSNMRNWFFEGYSSGKNNASYSGVYYIYSSDVTIQTLNSLKKKLFMAIIVQLAIFFFAALAPATSNKDWPGIPHILSIVPILYYAISFAYYRSTGLKLTLREYNCSIKHLQIWPFIGMILSIISALCVIIFAGINRFRLPVLDYIICLVQCFAFLVWTYIRREISKYPVSPSSNSQS